jgi:hypothetical protein
MPEAWREASRGPGNSFRRLLALLPAHSQPASTQPSSTDAPFPTTTSLPSSFQSHVGDPFLFHGPSRSLTSHSCSTHMLIPIQLTEYTYIHYLMYDSHTGTDTNQDLTTQSQSLAYCMLESFEFYYSWLLFFNPSRRPGTFCLGSRWAVVSIHPSSIRHKCLLLRCIRTIRPGQVTAISNPISQLCKSLSTLGHAQDQSSRDNNGDISLSVTFSVPRYLSIKHHTTVHCRS